MLEIRIASLRKASGMSQSQLANTLHISPATIGMYEQGRRTPNIDILVSMAHLFGVSLDYMITGTEFQSDHEIHFQPQPCPCHGCCHRRRCCEKQR